MTKETLETLIVNANNAYRSGNPIISDSEYDSMVDSYKRDYPDSYDMFRNTLNEGDIEISSDKKRSHGDVIMGSLEKLPLENPDDIIDFCKKYVKSTINISSKVDGISCRLHYKNGVLESATTRGDGHIGMAIDDKIKFVKYIPTSFSYSGDLDIRGELVIMKSDFENMTGYANPRNACAGIMNRTRSSKEWNESELKNISFVAYTILGDEYTKKDQFNLLKTFGFNVAWSEDVDINSIDIIEHLHSLKDVQYDYEIDGYVISDSEYKNEHEYRPTEQRAVKFNSLVGLSRLIDVEFGRPSKDGKIPMVGIIDPIPLGGAIISRVTLNNLDYIRKLNLGYGSDIEITKRGDIIPAITRVVSNEKSKPIETPSTCPCCGGDLTSDNLFLWCKNPDCKDQTTYQVQHFIVKLGVENTSFKSLQKYNIFTIRDLVKYTPNKKYKNELKLHDELKLKVFSKSEKDLFCAMNFKGLSETLLNKIVDHYGLDYIKGFTTSGLTPYEYFKNLPYGIGPAMINTLITGLQSALDNVALIVNDSRYNPCIEEKQIVNRLGISVCFTGSLNTMSRGQAQKKAEAAGWESKSSVTKGLTYLVTNESTMTTKMKKALELGTKIITEETFLSLLSGSDSISDL